MRGFVDQPLAEVSDDRIVEGAQRVVKIVDELHSVVGAKRCDEVSLDNLLLADRLHEKAHTLPFGDGPEKHVVIVDDDSSSGLKGVQSVQGKPVFPVLVVGLVQQIEIAQVCGRLDFGAILEKALTAHGDAPGTDQWLGRDARTARNHPVNRKVDVTDIEIDRFRRVFEAHLDIRVAAEKVPETRCQPPGRQIRRQSHREMGTARTSSHSFGTEGELCE